jgi:hypothetical protein
VDHPTVFAEISMRRQSNSVIGAIEVRFPVDRVALISTMEDKLSSLDLWVCKRVGAVRFFRGHPIMPLLP